MHTQSHNRGFTLIELMTVVAILGVVSVGIFFVVEEAQQNTRTAYKLTTVKQYQNALDNLRSQSTTNRYPAPTDISSGYACLGVGYENGTCYGGSAEESSAVNQALNNYLEGPPAFTHGANNLNGLLYRCHPNNDNCRGYELIWSVEGNNTSCAGGTGVKQGGYVVCTLQHYQQ